MKLKIDIPEKINIPVKIQKVGISILLALSLIKFVPFIDTMIVSMAILYALSDDSSDSSNNISAEYTKSMEDIIKISDEQDEVIREYEALLDEQVVSLPCACGEILYEGILSPNRDNFCICKSCKERYKVVASYDSLLISEPLDNSQVFDKLIDLHKTL